MEEKKEFYLIVKGEKVFVSEEVCRSMFVRSEKTNAKKDGISVAS